MIWRLAILLMFMALPLRAEEVVAGLSQNRVSISANFAGSEILIFGAVKRDAPVPGDAPLEVIITVEGPRDPVTVRRKDRRYGIWVNVEGIEVDLAPTFYNVATTAPLKESLKETEDLRHHISVPRAIRAVGVAQAVAHPEEFIDALIRINEENGNYAVNEDSIVFEDATLFNTSVALPANLREGDYKVRIFLTRSGDVVDAYETQIDVRKVGLERFLFTLAHEQPLIYGLLSLAIAIFAGWSASAVFAYLRG